MKPENAKYIWYDKEGLGRNLFGAFRKTFEIHSGVRKAEISIFADTVYQLFVNGSFIEFGPVRFDPRFPLYDTHDIAPYLNEGPNVIAVQVNHIGHNTFKSIPVRGCFVAWGEVIGTDGTVIDLATSKGTWRTSPLRAYSGTSPKLSFALNAADNFDQCLDEPGWREKSFDDSHWEAGVELEAQDAWGVPEPRSIPFMSGEEIKEFDIAHVLPLKRSEDLYSFEVPMTFAEEGGDQGYSRFIAYCAWIFSPEDQTVTAGTFWGETWINGEKVLKGTESFGRSLRITQRWKLKRGWNRYFGCVDAYQSVHRHYIGLPEGRGLVVSALLDSGSSYVFKRTPVLTAADFEKYIKGKPLPYDPDDDLEEIGGWIYTGENDKARCPCRETSWDDYGEPFGTMKSEEMNGSVFRLKDYPHGFSLLLDFRYMHLFLPIIELEGVEGATVDLTYSEHLNPDGLHLRIQSWIPLGDRAVCSRDFLSWIPSQPRGARYMNLTVRGIKNDITLKSLRFRSANYPVKRKGWFNCSDVCLNEIWKLGERTLAANMEDAFLDCSGRERGMYGRDVIIQYHVNLSTFGDHALMKRCLELFGQSPDDTGKFRAVYPNTGNYTIADFALDMAEGYLEYYKNTGDIELIANYWDAIQNNLRWFHNLADERDDLLLDAEWDVHKGIKSLYGGFHGDNVLSKGYMDKTGIHCVFSCTYLISMRCALQLAQVLGRIGDMEELERRINILAAAIPEKFWDAGADCFGDNLEKRTHSVQANLMAVRAGVVDRKMLEGIERHTAKSLRSIFVNGYDPSEGAYLSPHYSFFILDGLYKAGLYDAAENVMRQGWGWMLAMGLKTCAEFFSLDFSLCHAWSASPTYYLSKYVLGVNFPNAPDFDEVEIDIRSRDVTFAEGAYPHPKGLIEVKWHMEDGNRVFDYIKAPAGVIVKVVE